MVNFEYKIQDDELIYEFKNLADAWKFADENNLKRCERVEEKEKHPYRRGPAYWEKHLMFWRSSEPGKKKYSQNEIDYYDSWLSEMFSNERVNTKLQSGIN